MADSTADSVIGVIGATLFKVTVEINRVSREQSDKRSGSDPASILEEHRQVRGWLQARSEPTGRRAVISGTNYRMELRLLDSDS